MNPVRYLKEHGIKYSLDTVYKYKLDIVLNKLMKPFLCNKPLKNIIVIESHNDFDNNGGALYNYLIEHGYNKKYKIVWLIKHPESVYSNLPHNVTWVAEYKPSFKKSYYKWIAKWISYDQDCSAKLRDDQITIFMNHGPVCLKDCTGTYNIPQKLDYFLTASDWWRSYDAKQFFMDKNDNRFEICGYPVHDVLYTKEKGDLHKIINKKYDKIVLWMPTFRKTEQGRLDSKKEFPLGIPLIMNATEYEELNTFLKDNKILMLIKTHPKQDSTILKIKDLDNIIVLTSQRIKQLNVDNYRLMKDADALISDYSSVAYDFLHLNRPLAYDFSDIDDYDRGIIVEDINEMLAGQIIKKIEDMYLFLSTLKEGKDSYYEKRKEIFDKVFKYHDGNSCKRVVDLLKID